MWRLRWRQASLWVGLLVSLVFAYLAVRDVDAAAFGTALREMEYWVLAPAALVLALAIFLRAVRWRLLFAPRHRPSTSAITTSLLIGYLFNNILPARAGEAARIIALKQRAGTARFEALGTVVAERALDVVCLIVLLFAVAPTLPGVDWLPRALAVGGGLSLGLVALLIAMAFYGHRPARLLLRPLSLLPGISGERSESAATNLVHGFSFLRRPASAVAAVLLTLVSWLLIALSFWLCLLGFDFGLGFEAGLLVVVAVNLAMILPSGPAAVGVFEAATLVALGVFGVDRSSAFSYAVVVHALNVIPFIVVGYLVLHQHAIAVRRGRNRSPRAQSAGEGG
jgi:glycosyltransferase 2 family protein